MGAFITCTILGVLVSIIGILNIRGNIYTMHWYHRQRVAPQDVKPFGKLVGVGTLMIGASAIVYGVLSLISWITEADIYSIVGATMMAVCVIVGCAISFYAMIKYNHGIF